MDQDNSIRYGKLILAPAIITLGITLLRLCAEFVDLPAWLANKGPGGVGALIGISWLPPILGIYFAIKLKGAPGKLWKNLLKTLVLYGLAARIPVILIMGFAIFGDWGTHYAAFPPGALADATLTMKFIMGGVVAQIVWWMVIWTVGLGMVTGLVTSFIQSRRSKTN